MAVFNTASDAANTAARAFLTKIGEYYLGRSFNTGLGKAKADWLKIKDEIFGGKCAYCGKSDPKLQMDHLIMFNREGCGLHHPGNLVPACSICNKRIKAKENIYKNWEDHLSFLCEQNNEIDQFHARWKRINKHINEGEFKYPTLTTEESKAISIIANNLYESIKNEFAQAVKLFEDLEKVYGNRDRPLF